MGLILSKTIVLSTGMSITDPYCCVQILHSEKEEYNSNTTNIAFLVKFYSSEYARANKLEPIHELDRAESCDVDWSLPIPGQLYSYLKKLDFYKNSIDTL